MTVSPTTAWVVTESTPKQPAADGAKSRTRLVVGIILLALLIAFVIDNTRRVTVGFVFFDHQIRLIYVLIFTVIIGVVLDRLWQHWRRN
jgi:uncharacterized integral membrane protein